MGQLPSTISCLVVDLVGVCVGQLPSTISCLVVDLVGVCGTTTIYNKLSCG